MDFKRRFVRDLQKIEIVKKDFSNIRTEPFQGDDICADKGTRIKTSF